MKRRTKAQLEEELEGLRRRVAELGGPQAGPGKADMPLPHERRGLEQYLDVLGVIVVFLDAEGRIALINKRGREVFGYEDKEIRGENWFELCVPPELREKARGVFRVLVAGMTDSIEYYEGRVLTKAGGVRTIIWHGTVTRDAEGKVTGVLCSGEDITDRKRAEEALRESEERYRRLVELSPDTIAVHTEGKIAFINAAGARLLGAASAEELVGRPIMDFLHPDYRETVVERFREMKESGSHASLIEEKFIRLDGKEVDVEVAAMPVTYGGRPAVQAVVRDITERVRAQTEVRFRAQILEELQDGVNFSKQDARVILHVNARFAEMFGYEPDELVGANVSILNAPDEKDPAEKVAEVLQCLNDDGHWIGDVRNIRKDGSVFWTRATVLPMEHPTHGSIWVAVQEDITDRKLVEEALRESEGRYRTIFTQALNPILVADEDGKYVDANAAALEFLECTRDDLLQKTVWDYSPPELLEEQKREHSPFASPRTLETEYAVHGRQKTLLLNVVPLAVTESGKTTVYGIGQDISERKRLEREVLEICARERRRIGEDLHDGLGQHLTGVSLLSKALAQKLAASSSPESDEAEKIGELVNQAIGWTRDLARAAHPVAPEPEGLVSALEAMASGAEKVFGISCDFSFDRTVSVDDNSVATHLYRIAQEALSNAVRHGKAKHVDISLGRIEGGIRLSVTDDGKGIPEALDEGKGLGLRIMSYRATMIGGSFDVRREPTGGTAVVCSARARTGA